MWRRRSQQGAVRPGGERDLRAPRGSHQREAAGDLLEGDEQPDPQELRELAWGTLIPEYNEQVGELQTLDPPEELSEEYQRYLDMSASTREEITQDPSVLADAATFEEVNRQADQIGLSPDCRVGPG